MAGVVDSPAKVYIRALDPREGDPPNTWTEIGVIPSDDQVRSPQVEGWIDRPTAPGTGMDIGSPDG